LARHLNNHPSNNKVRELDKGDKQCKVDKEDIKEGTKVDKEDIKEDTKEDIKEGIKVDKEDKGNLAVVVVTVVDVEEAEEALEALEDEAEEEDAEVVWEEVMAIAETMNHLIILNLLSTQKVQVRQQLRNLLQYLSRQLPPLHQVPMLAVTVIQETIIKMPVVVVENNVVVVAVKDVRTVDFLK